MKNTIAIKIFFITVLTLIYVWSANAQSSEVFSLTSGNLQNEKPVALDKLAWKYHAGDDLAWANPDFDDSDWETLNGTILPLDNLPKSDWNGIGWFRLHLKVDESLINQQLALIMDHWGASEVYIDGRLVNRFGTVGATPEIEEAFKPRFKPFFFEFRNHHSEHLIAVRLSVMAARDLSTSWNRFFPRMYTNVFPGGGNLVGVNVSVVRSPNEVRDY